MNARGADLSRGGWTWPVTVCATLAAGGLTFLLLDGDDKDFLLLAASSFLLATTVVHRVARVLLANLPARGGWNPAIIAGGSSLFATALVTASTWLNANVSQSVSEIAGLTVFLAMFALFLGFAGLSPWDWPGPAFAALLAATAIVLAVLLVVAMLEAGTSTKLPEATFLFLATAFAIAGLVHAAAWTGRTQSQAPNARAGWTMVAGGVVLLTGFRIGDRAADYAWPLLLLSSGMALLLIASPIPTSHAGRARKSGAWSGRLLAGCIAGTSLGFVIIGVLTGDNTTNPRVLSIVVATALGVLALVLTYEVDSLLLANNRLSRQRGHLLHQSLIDPLTGIANRRALGSQMSAELARSTRFGHEFSVVLFDIDDFKAINDRLGHAAGDGALCHIARILAGSARSIDTIGRFGGEEFFAVLPETSCMGAEVMASRAVSCVARRPVQDGANVVHLSISAGIACYPKHALDTQGLLEAADRALYDAKRAGKNRTCIAVR